MRADKSAKIYVLMVVITSPLKIKLIPTGDRTLPPCEREREREMVGGREGEKERERARSKQKTKNKQQQKAITSML